jgi:arginyl-tRNA synthetase
MHREAERKTIEQGKTEGFTDAELQILYETIGLGGLKFFLLRVDPKKKMLFNPEESIDLHGYTATFIQYAYARIRSIFRKEGGTALGGPMSTALLPLEKALIVVLEKYPSIVAQAGEELNPSLIAAYAFQVAQTFNSFYNVHSVANAESPEKKLLRLRLAQLTANVLRSGMALLGIKMPERM